MMRKWNIDKVSTSTCWDCRTSAAAAWNFVWRGAELLNKNNTLPRLISPPKSNNITDSSSDPINQSGQESSRLLFSNCCFSFDLFDLTVFSSSNMLLVIVWCFLRPFFPLCIYYQTTADSIPTVQSVLFVRPTKKRMMRQKVKRRKGSLSNQRRQKKSMYGLIGNSLAKTKASIRPIQWKT